MAKFEYLEGKWTLEVNQPADMSTSNIKFLNNGNLLDFLDADEIEDLGRMLLVAYKAARRTIGSGHRASVAAFLNDGEDDE